MAADSIIATIYYTLYNKIIIMNPLALFMEYRNARLTNPDTGGQPAIKSQRKACCKDGERSYSFGPAQDFQEKGLLSFGGGLLVSYES